MANDQLILKTIFLQKHSLGCQRENQGGEKKGGRARTVAAARGVVNVN